MVHRHTQEDLRILYDVLIDNDKKITTSIIDSPAGTNLVIRRAGVDILTLQNDRVNMANGFTLHNDVLINNTVSTNQILSDRFRCKNYNVDVDFDGGNSTEDGRITYIAFRRQFEDIRMLRDVKIDAGKKMSSNVYDSTDNNDVYLKRNNIDYIQLGGTSLRTRLLTGCQSDIYDSLEHSEVKFRRNDIDFFYLRNGQVELNVTLEGEVVDTSDKT